MTDIFEVTQQINFTSFRYALINSAGIHYILVLYKYIALSVSLDDSSKKHLEYLQIESNG